MRATAAGLAFAVAACASRPPVAAAPAPAPPTGPDSASAAVLTALYRARMDSARTRYAPADAAFMTGMIVHHAQALLMAGMAPTHGASPSIRTLAARITNAQRDEIALMQRWLADRGLPVPQPHIDGTMLMVHGAEGHMHMPGMLTDEQMRALDAARDTAFDRAFLTFMIQHHRGAVTMVDSLIATDGAAREQETFKLASDVQVDQQTEIARMERMLHAVPATPARNSP